MDKEKHMIWSSDAYLDGAFQDECREWLIEECGLEDPSDDDVITEAYEKKRSYFYDEQSNLSNVEGRYLVAFGSLSRWDGHHRAYKVLESSKVMDAVEEVMRSFEGDNTFHVFVEEGDLIVSQYGHDNPVSPSIIKIRGVIPELIDDGFYDDSEDAIYNADEAELDERTIKFGPIIAEVYGWELDKE